MPPDNIDLGVKAADGALVYPVLMLKTELQQPLHYDETPTLRISARVAKVERREDEQGVHYLATLELHVLEQITP